MKSLYRFIGGSKHGQLEMVECGTERIEGLRRDAIMEGGVFDSRDPAPADMETYRRFQWNTVDRQRWFYVVTTMDNAQAVKAIQKYLAS